MAGRNPDDFPGRWITVTEAIGIFGVSERTIRRRLATGLLPTKHEGNRVLIYLYDTPPDNRQADASTVSGGKETGERLTELQAENRRLQAIVDQLTEENKRVWEALAREQAISMTSVQKLIEASSSQPAAADPESKTPARQWWKFWGKG